MRGYCSNENRSSPQDFQNKLEKKSHDNIFLQAFSSGADVSLSKEEWVKGLSVFMVVTIFNITKRGANPSLYTGRHSRRAYTVLLQCIWHKVGTKSNKSFHHFIFVFCQPQWTNQSWGSFYAAQKLPFTQSSKGGWGRKCEGSKTK